MEIYLDLAFSESVAELFGDFPELSGTDDAIFVQIKHFKIRPVHPDLIRSKTGGRHCAGWSKINVR